MNIFSSLILTYKRAFSGLPRNAWLLALVVFVNRSGSMVLFFLSLYLTSRKGFSVRETGQILSIYGAGALGGSYMGGLLSDRIGAKNIQMLSLLLSAAGFIVLGYCDSVFTLGITLFLLATVNEAFRPANASALSEFCPPQIRPRGFALNRQAINLGIAVGPALGGVLAMYDYHLLFWADGLTCFLAALLIWRLVPQTTLHLKSNTDTQATRLSPWNDFPYLLLLSLLLYLGLVFYQVFNTWPVYLKAFYHLPESQIGLLMGFNALLIVLVEMPLIHRIERYDQIKIIAFGSFLLIVGFAMMPLGNGFFFAILTVLIWTIGEMLVFPLSVGFIANRADDSSRGRYMGMYTFTFAIAFVFGPFTGTTIYDTFGPELLWYGIGAVGIPVIFGFRFVHRRMK